MIMLIGWLGAALVLVSYAQRNTVRLRQTSLLASAALLSFNLIVGIWPNVALEVALAVVNLRRLIQPQRPFTRPTPTASATATPSSLGPHHITDIRSDAAPW
jgi:hypothetical protein